MLSRFFTLPIAKLPIALCLETGLAVLLYRSFPSAFAADTHGHAGLFACSEFQHLQGTQQYSD